MMAAPKAISHGLGSAAGAALTAFTGMSAANAGTAAETASAATTDNTTFFIRSAPFNSIGPRVPADPLCLPTEPQMSPGGDRSVCVLTALTRKFRPVAGGRGKPKTVAIAAFLGELAPGRQKDGSCCVNVTNWDRQRLFCHHPRSYCRPNRPGFPHPDVCRQTIFRPIRIDVFKPPPPFCGWPLGAS